MKLRTVGRRIFRLQICGRVGQVSQLVGSFDWAVEHNLTTYPTYSFTILELQNPLHDVPEVHEIHQSPDREALKL